MNYLIDAIAIALFLLFVGSIILENTQEKDTEKQKMTYISGISLAVCLIIDILYTFVISVI